MTNSTRKRSVVAALLVVLLLGTMTAAAWHRHDTSKFETCQACYLSKHTLTPLTAGPIVNALAVVSLHLGSYGAPQRRLVAFTRADLRAPPAETPSRLGR